MDATPPPDDRPSGPDVDFGTAQRRAYEEEGLDVESLSFDLGDPYGHVHVVKTGDPAGEPPVLFLHGVMNFGAMFAPLMARLADAALLSVDRPGWGSSDDYRYDVATHRETIVAVLDGVLDALDLDEVDLVGHSTGGYWALRFALARPGRVRRVVAVGGVPAFPGTTPPLALRLFTVPALARLLVPRGHPTPETVVEQLSVVGERETIQRYPGLVAARVAHDRDPRALPVAVSELRSFQTLRGWRTPMRLDPADLDAVDHPTLFVWGEGDFLGTPDDVRAHVESMPNARLETPSGGHIPWLGHPDACADLVRAART